MKTKKVSIMLIHYNQKQFIKNALDSVFKQTYKNIELIIADDATPDFDLKDIKKYVEKINKQKYPVKYQVNKENICTVKNINKALDKVTGDYLLIFAADDQLHDENVITNMVEFYNKQDKDVSIVFGQCLMMDYDLKELKEEYINVTQAEEFNKLSAKEQYNFLSSNCFAAMGACMLNTKILKDEGKFDERFKFIEDWVYFLKTTLNNHRMQYLDYICLLHRDGGISHNQQLSEARIGFITDLLKESELYILPYFDRFNNEEKNKVVDFYVINRDYLNNNNCHYDDKEYKALQKKYPKFFIIRKLKQFNKEYKIKVKKGLKRIEALSIIIILLILLNEHFDNKYEIIFNYGIIFFLVIILIMLLKILFLSIIKIFSKIKK